MSGKLSINKKGITLPENSISGSDLAFSLGGRGRELPEFPLRSLKIVSERKNNDQTEAQWLNRGGKHEQVRERKTLNQQETAFQFRERPRFGPWRPWPRARSLIFFSLLECFFRERKKTASNENGACIRCGSGVDFRVSMSTILVVHTSICTRNQRLRLTTTPHIFML